MSVKIYAMNKATPLLSESYNKEFIEPAVKKSDYDKLLAAIEELKNECFAWAEDSHAELDKYKEDLAANIQAAMDSVK